MNSKQGTLLAVAMACCGMGFAAEVEKDAAAKAKPKSQAASALTPAGGDAGKSNIASPGTPLADVPLKDRKIVAPDDFGGKDRKIVVQPDKRMQPDKGNVLVPGDSAKKPILATPAVGPATAASTTAGK